MPKYMGLDLGSVTCGVSWSETGFIAGTVKTIRFPSDDYDTALDRIEELVQEMKPDIIVLGLPLLENGDAAERAQICLEFGKVLEKETGIPVKMQDERNTTQESEAILLEADVSRRHRKKKIDQLAAVAILQRWLDANQK
ncbi:MAG: Holliday junction resolvase RuvX [Erysipelotrichaceae bacterium]|jgi:putative Holliday junction resolvase|nr:Holliday junction resolvase RuvX [Erysipelotrichaceae bacterium]